MWLWALIFTVHALQHSTPPAMALGKQCQKQENFSLALHGGAVWRSQSHKLKEEKLREVLHVGREQLNNGASALNVVEFAIKSMEDSGLFNAGKGGIANQAGEVELDASIMEGRHLRAGAVGSVRNLKNPISAALSVMNDTPHVMMVGPMADQHLTGLGNEKVDQSYFLNSGKDFSDLKFPKGLEVPVANESVPSEKAGFTGVWAGVLQGRLRHVAIMENIGTEEGMVTLVFGQSEELGMSQPTTVKAKAAFLNDFLVAETDQVRMAYRLGKDGKLEARLSNKKGGRASGHLTSNPDILRKSGTVGAVALDRCGSLAAGTSTGGFNSKIPGRIGDSPIIGAGTYADNRGAAVSATGHGEYFIRHAVAHEIVARVRHGGESLVKAAYQVIFKELGKSGGQGGVIAIDKNGEVVMLFNTDGMVRGRTTHLFGPKVDTYISD